MQTEPTATSQAKWPQRLFIIRHGESAGNVARDAAEAASLPSIDIVTRDIDTPLSRRGEQQSRAVGRWLHQLHESERPDVVLCSPYVRARDTARLILESAAMADMELVADERLREKEFGILDRLTRFGITERYPELAAQRAHVGKFYFRPPGGESWCDVILRLRSVLETVVREYRGRRVLIVSHQVIVNCMRYLLERLDEQQILDIDRAGDVPNCGVTCYAFDPGKGRHGKLVPTLINFVAPLQDAGEAVTAAPDMPAAPKP